MSEPPNARSVVRSIIFDLDGTLVDSAPAVGEALNAMRAENGLEPLPTEAFRRWISLGAPELLRRSLEIGPEKLTASLDDFRRLYRTMPTRIDHVFPGAAQTLAQLRRRGLRIGMCSNKPTPLCRKIVDELHLSDFFDALVGGEPGCPPKPDPAPLRRALEAIGADPRSSLFVGDSTIDQKTAAACSVPFVFFSSGYDDGVNHGDAFRVISRLEEILELTR